MRYLGLLTLILVAAAQAAPIIDTDNTGYTYTAGDIQFTLQLLVQAAEGDQINLQVNPPAGSTWMALGTVADTTHLLVWPPIGYVGPFPAPISVDWSASDDPTVFTFSFDPADMGMADLTKVYPYTITYSSGQQYEIADGDFTFVPAPGALLLGTLGIACVGLIRRRVA